MTERYDIVNETPIKNKVLLVFDGHSYFHRAYNVVKNSNLTEKETIETTTSLFLDMIDRVVDRSTPDEFIIIFDTNRQTLLKKLIYADYKVNRPPPSDIQKQCENNLMDTLFNQSEYYSYYSKEGYEADQIIAGICLLAEQKNIVTIIATKDKDLCELLKYADVMIYDNHEYHGREYARKKFNVEPEQIGDYLSLVGDVSDNIPGVSKVGHKTASTLLNQFSTLENIYNNINNINPKWKTLLENDKDKALLSKQLTDLTPSEELLIAIKSNLLYLN